MENREQTEKRYIVFDLEWNQSSEGRDRSVPDLPFEVIEIGAVRLNEKMEITGEFSRIVRPAVYERLHYKVIEIMHVGMEELRKRGEPFPDVLREFLSWCEEASDGRAVKPVFCTWGNMDLTELQRNIRYYGIDNPFPYPLLYYDAQKLFNLLYEENSKDKLPLDGAAELLGIVQDRPFHRALDDARYTALVMQKMEFGAVKEYLSIDYFRLPESVEEEIYMIFPNYSKYVSHPFETREDAIADKTVTDVICYRCNRMLRKKIRWFSANQRNYYCLAWCPEHGFVRSKIRMKHAPDGGVFVIKTTKLVDESGVRRMELRKEEMTKKRNMKNRSKREKKTERDGE